MKNMDWALYGYKDESPYGEFLGEARTKEDLKQKAEQAIANGYRIQYVHADGSLPDFTKTINTTKRKR